VVPGVLADAPPDSLLTLLPPRAVEIVQQDLATAEAMEGAAKADMVSAQGRLGEAKAQVNVRKSEVETIKAKIKLAKEQKNQTEQENLERQGRAMELRAKVLEARTEMREAEVSFADARREAAQTQSGFLKKELELLGKRNDLVKMNSAGQGATNLDGLVRLQTEIRDLERRCLEILKDVAEKAKHAAEDESSLLGKRLKLHDGQLALIGGARK
jgi:chromosome segregation ATPase